MEFCTNFFNVRSGAAIKRLGAKLDGVSRNHGLMPDGTIRDSCVYSIIASQWPGVKRNLHYLIEIPRR